MIDPELRLFAPTGSIPAAPTQPSTWDFIDFDTRRWIHFEGPTEVFGIDDGQEATKALLTIVDELDENVTTVTFSADGQFSGSGTKTKDNITPIVYYPVFQESLVGDIVHNVLVKDRWVEKDRLGPGTDLVSVSTSSMAEKLLVFKYVLVRSPCVMDRLWRSGFIHRALHHHPNIVPFGSFVVDIKTNRFTNASTSYFVGYTTKFMFGGSLDVRSMEIFKVKWLDQLINLVDELNLKYGVVHQDIAPRNLLLDQDQMLLFDFEMASFLEGADVMRDFIDVIGLTFTIYELLTGDGELGCDPRERRLESIMEMEEWRLKETIKLEPGVTTHDIKTRLHNWVQSRMQATPETQFALRNKIFCPDVPEDPCLMDERYRSGLEFPPSYVREATRKTHVVHWQRPATAARVTPRAKGLTWPERASRIASWFVSMLGY